MLACMYNIYPDVFLLLQRFLCVILLNFNARCIRHALITMGFLLCTCQTGFDRNNGTDCTGMYVSYLLYI